MAPAGTTSNEEIRCQKIKLQKSLKLSSDIKVHDEAVKLRHSSTQITLECNLIVSRFPFIGIHSISEKVIKSTISTAYVLEDAIKKAGNVSLDIQPCYRQNTELHCTY